MNELTCREIDELLAGYASDALEETERCTAATHLAECRNHDAELQALRGSLASLAAVVEPVPPPDALRNRLLDAFDREVARPPAVLTERPARRTRLIATPNLGYALAAGMLIIAVVLGVWGASRGGGAEVLVRATTDDSGSVQVVYIPSRSLGVLDYDLVSLPAGRTYQAWHVDKAGNPVSLGVLSGTRGSLSFTSDLASGSSVALTIEPAGGSAAPTTTPFLVTPLGGT
jgi:anti-sigma-K factor RskA